MKDQKTEPCIFAVRHGGYPFDVLVAMGVTNEELAKVLDEYEGLDKKGLKSVLLDRIGAGTTVMFRCGATIIRLRDKWDASTKAHNHLAHEVFHAVHFLMMRIGMRLSRDSDEAYAYAIGNLTEQILAQLALPATKRTRP